MTINLPTAIRVNQYRTAKIQERCVIRLPEPATCAVVVSTDGIRLVGQNGAGAVILENAGGQEQGIAVAKGGASGPSCLTDSAQRVQGAVVQGFTVNGFDGDGIFLLCVDNW